MRRVPRPFGLLALTALVALPAPAAAATGGASAESAPGGSQDGARSGALVYGAPSRQRPVARVFRVSPGAVTEGRAPLIRVRIDERGIDRVQARIVAIESGSRRVGARVDLGKVRTGRVVRIRWPEGQLPAEGTYTVRLHVKDPQGATLARAASATGKAKLIVRPRPRPESPQPEPQAQPSPSTPVPSTPAQAGGVFPVAGPYSFGGEGGQFGAGRGSRSHEGQDILAAQGTPVVSPVAGTIASVDVQAGGAGTYIVLDADDGRAMFFAHLQDGSPTVQEGRRVTAGQVIARVGSSGASSGPHLHFEIWEGGWRDRGGKPVDPLAQLRAWAA